MYLGCHLSASKGYAAMVRQAEKLGADTFAFFTRNPRGSKSKAEDPKDAELARKLLEAGHFGPLVAHGAYTMNLCTQEEEARQFAAQVLADDLRRMAAIPGNLYNFHPGSHVGRGGGTGHRGHRRRLAPSYGPGVSGDSAVGDHGRQGQRSGFPV